MEEKLRFMFKEIQTPFELHCPKNRKNFYLILMLFINLFNY